jgi:hypothetical protein
MRHQSTIVYQKCTQQTAHEAMLVAPEVDK